MLVFQVAATKRTSPVVYNNWFLGADANNQILGCARFAIEYTVGQYSKAGKKMPFVTTSANGRYEVTINRESNGDYTVSLFDKITKESAYYEINRRDNTFQRIPGKGKPFVEIGSMKKGYAFYHANANMTDADQVNVTKILQVMLGSEVKADGYFGKDTMKAYLDQYGAYALKNGLENGLYALPLPRQPTAWNALEYFMDQGKSKVPAKYRDIYAEALLKNILPSVKDVHVTKEGMEYTLFGNKHKFGVQEQNAIFYVAVVAYQKDHKGVTMDGLVGPETLKALNEEPAVKNAMKLKSVPMKTYSGTTEVENSAKASIFKKGKPGPQ